MEGQVLESGTIIIKWALTPLDLLLQKYETSCQVILEILIVFQNLLQK